MAKSAASYPITTPYGYKGWPYNYLKPHHGDDRAMPTGTAVTVSKTLIGRSGNTGFSTGPHLHVDKYVSPKGVPFLGWPRQYYNPEDKGTFKVTGRVVFAGWLGTAGKTVIIKKDSTQTSGKRIFYRYIHLSEINVKKGDWIG